MILLQLVEQEAGQGLKEDKSPEVVRGPSPLKDFFFLTIMTMRSSQVTIIISSPASGSHSPGSPKVKFFCPIQLSYTVGKVLKNAL